MSVDITGDGPQITATGTGAAITLSVTTGSGGGGDGAVDSDDVAGPIRVFVRVHIPVAGLGGTVGSGVATIAALNGVPTDGIIWLLGQTDNADNGFYAKTATNTFTETTDYLSGIDHVARLIVVSADLAEASGPTGYVISAPSGTAIATRVTLTSTQLATALTPYALAATVDAIPAAVATQGSRFNAPDDDIEAFTSDDLCLVADGGSGGWSIPYLGDTPDGIDFRLKVRFRRPDDMPTQRYMELLTQTNDLNWGDDNFEAAILWPDETYPDERPGVPHMFWEHTPDRSLFTPEVDGEVGFLDDPADWSTSNRGATLTADAALSAGEWATLRFVQDTATDTISFYREVVPLTGGDDVTADDREWALIRSWTFPYAGSMEPGIETDWIIGKQLLGDIAWFEIYDGPDGDLLAAVTATELAAAGVGATTVADAVSGTWTAGSAAVGYVNPLGAALAAIPDPPASHTHFASGALYSNPNVLVGGTREVRASRATATPIVIPADVTIDALQIDLASAVAASTPIDIHLFASSNGYPTGAPVASASVTTSGVGVQALLGTTASPVIITAGAYWAVIHNRAAATNHVTSRSVNSGQHLEPLPYTGGTTTPSCYLTDGGAVSTTAITAFPAVANTTAQNQGPMVAYRVD